MKLRQAYSIATHTLLTLSTFEGVLYLHHFLSLFPSCCVPDPLLARKPSICKNANARLNIREAEEHILRRATINVVDITMATPLNSTSAVHEGFWIDWKGGSIWGATLTLCPTNATILTNSLAMFVTLCGIQLWAVIRYTLHGRFTSLQPEAPTPFLNRQKRVILRNANSALSTARLMFELGWNSRSKTGKHSLSAYLIGIWAVIYATAFMAAGILSSKVVSAASAHGGSPVLLRSNHCGVWNETYLNIVVNSTFTNEDEFGLGIQWYTKMVDDVQQSLEYAQGCYISSPSSTDTASPCYTFKNSTLRSTMSIDQSCPFDAKMCHNAADTLVLDTGFLDSYEHLGINARPTDRLKYQQLTTCAVLNDTSHIVGWDGILTATEDSVLNSKSAYAYYGASHLKGTNWTYAYSNYADFYDNFSAITTKPYQLGVAQSVAFTSPQHSPSDFKPITELVRDDADVSLLFLSFAGMYLGPVEDPWFSAHTEQHFKNKYSFLQERFTRDVAISTIGCIEQHNICTPDRCTGLLGFDQVQNVKAFTSALSPHQNATFDRLLRAVSTARLYYIVQALSQTTTPLLASIDTLYGKSGAAISPPVQYNQWKLELDYLHSIAMAQVQRSIVQYATGQIDPDPDSVGHLLPPPLNQDRWFCDSMIVYSGFYQSFRVAAMVLIVVVGAMIAVLSLFVDDLARWTRKCLKRPASTKHWDGDDMLELQRSTPRTPRGRCRRSHMPRTDVFRRTSPSDEPQGNFVLTAPAPISAPSHRTCRCTSHNVSPNFCHTVNTSRNLSCPDGAIRLEPPTRPRRESWLTISLNSLDLTSPRTPTSVGNRKFPRLPVGLPSAAAANTSQGTASECSQTVGQNMRWI